MPEAVVVATARSPIGRAFKGTMTSIRPDDLTILMIKAALAKVPELDPADVDDLMLGCGQPGGEQDSTWLGGAVMLGYDSLPGTTSTDSAHHRCSGWPSTRSVRRGRRLTPGAV
jgi:acetyl-CoA C-acetyltransferase